MAQINKPTDYFEPVLYTGDDSNNRTINTTENFQADFFWVKDRSNAASHCLMDITRSTFLSTNTTGAEQALSGLGWNNTAPASTGFTVDYGSNPSINGTGRNFVSWCWNAGGTASSNTDGSITSSVSANTTSGFSIVSYTGTGANATVGHGLGSTPKVVIVKNRTDAGTNWHTYHGAISGRSGGYITLNTTDAFQTNVTTIWNGDHNSTVVDLGSNNNSNGSGDSMIAYCFAEKKGFSKFGSFAGNGSNDGTFVYTGFKPAFVITKLSSGTGSWFLHDNKRNGFNGSNAYFYPDTNAAEMNTVQLEDFVSNGFKMRFSGGANSSGTSIYMAFAESPLVGTNNIPATAR